MRHARAELETLAIAVISSIAGITSVLRMCVAELLSGLLTH
jgi:hypothetical protein